MKAILYDSFEGPFRIDDVPKPEVPNDGVVIEVKASGICRSDWHGWMGHDPAITSFPHVPGHECAGTILDVGAGIQKWEPGDRVTTPFCCGCGVCPQCEAGFPNVCDNDYQPGFTAWGTFAEYVAIRYADNNLARLPDDLDYVSAASLGCRFTTAFRGVVDQGCVRKNQWVAVYGCGGVGLSAIMIASALGARVIGVDISEEKLTLAQSAGAEETLNASEVTNPATEIHEITDGGAHVSIDALGSTETATNSICSLRKRGRHVQIGLTVGDESDVIIPMDQVIAREMEIVGSHGIQASRYKEVFSMISDGKIDPGRLVQKIVPLEDAAAELKAMAGFDSLGMTVINRF
ncbi:MAG: zinc-dependent alcohol dehydrogenase family protein [Candidatus Marinimicrobia bacterium]|jgi:alcohol dehydrogenase|nr:alcohol dehydrogenase [Candidatus Neomarinimicrobiota bacterium]MDP6457626.1 zinc-dependent alcohol dehydrogenase family protein [Candidatus Neomarinimicrobiota bacterium]MDP6836955.1 zinc-dependent alcohol dehydrogenase family protein [Candidatus Neomarinimicrobiota bacterium]|tara:strand:+ start:4091 stop:5134 length:1044 start_codon:yes stop_codon:yes gene_type:complete